MEKISSFRAEERFVIILLSRMIKTQFPPELRFTNRVFGRLRVP